MPTPSPAQNVPNDVSITPTVNLSVFSGTRLSGCRTSAPMVTTATRATVAPAAATAVAPWFAPSVITMNATSRPSSSVDLNEMTRL